MIEKTIGVIPPRSEPSSFPDKKAENSKDKKSEFESFLNQSSRQDKKPDNKEKIDQALGGTKKRVREIDQKLAHKSEKTKDKDNKTEGVERKKDKKLVGSEMVLGGMASFESANKTPDSEVNPDDLETTQLNINEVNVAPAAEAILAPDAEVNEISDKALASLGEMQQNGDLPTKADLKVGTESVAAFIKQLAQPEKVDPTAVETEPSMLPANGKVLETLNLEQMFQKLEAMKKTEEPEVKMDTQNTTDGVSLAHTKTEAPVEKSTTFQSSDQGQDESTGDDKGKAELQPLPNHQSHLTHDFKPVAEARINNPEGAKDADAANLKEILNQAQYLVTKGGGEVSVKMTPEGMGEVQLKVMMENGKMSVEMNTQDKNVQKLIQDSLSDLKSSLAAHQISVEHVTLNNKINTVYAAQDTRSAQNFTDAHAHHQSQHSHQRDQRQQSGQVLEHETMKALPLAKNEINKASAQRVYQTHKAQSLNAVA